MNKSLQYFCLFLGHILITDILMSPCWTYQCPIHSNIYPPQDTAEPASQTASISGKMRVRKRAKFCLKTQAKFREERRKKWCCSLWTGTMLSCWGQGVREWLGLSASWDQPVTAGRDSLVLLCPWSFSITKLWCISSRNKGGRYQ